MGPVGELLRREGIYSADLACIRQKVKEGALKRLPDRPSANLKSIANPFGNVHFRMEIN